MERKRGTALVVIITLTVAIISLGIAFAAFSSQLTINGTATVQSSNWKIHFATSSSGSDPGSAGTTVTASLSNNAGWTATSTSTESTLKTASFTWAGTLKTPGDQISYKFYIRNVGNYRAKITSINTPELSCTKGGSTETTICGKVTYGLYTDSTGETPLAQNTTIAAGSYQEVYLIAKLATNVTAAQLPNSNVTVNPTTISITYTQY